MNTRNKEIKKLIKNLRSNDFPQPESAAQKRLYFYLSLCYQNRIKELKSLSLSHSNLNNFSVNAWQTMATAMRLLNVKKLDLSGNSLDQLAEPAWQILYELLRENGVTELNMTGNDLAAGKQKKLQDILKANHGIYINLPEKPPVYSQNKIGLFKIDTGFSSSTYLKLPEEKSTQYGPIK